MTPDEIAQLAALLRKLADEGGGTPRMPWEVFSALRGVVCQPALEIFVTRTGRDVLLTARHDRSFRGHHIPGGFVGAWETLDTAAERIAKRELGVAAQPIRIVGHHTWAEHPFASPLSLLCLCKLAGEPTDGAFFDRDALPPDLLPDHRQLLDAYWATA